MWCASKSIKSSWRASCTECALLEHIACTICPTVLEPWSCGLFSLDAQRGLLTRCRGMALGLLEKNVVLGYLGRHVCQMWCTSCSTKSAWRKDKIWTGKCCMPNVLCIEKAQKVLDKLPVRDVASWNALFKICPTGAGPWSFGLFWEYAKRGSFGWSTNSKSWQIASRFLAAATRGLLTIFLMYNHSTAIT